MFLTMVLAAHCAQAIGFDATDRFLLLAQEEARRRDVHSVSFHHGDAEHLPYADAEFALLFDDLGLQVLDFRESRIDRCPSAVSAPVPRGRIRLHIDDPLR